MAWKPDPVYLKAGETEFLLASNINALCELEVEFGEGINRIIERFQNPIDLRMIDVRRYLRVVLRSGDKPMDVQHADDVCAAAGIHVCSSAVTSHLISMFGNNGEVK